MPHEEVTQGRKQDEPERQGAGTPGSAADTTVGPTCGLCDAPESEPVNQGQAERCCTGGKRESKGRRVEVQDRVPVANRTPECA